MLGKGNDLSTDALGSGGFDGTPSHPRRIRTLVADNSATFENVIVALLRMGDCVEVLRRVTERQETIEAVNSLQPDLLLIDLGMPEFGITTVAVLSERYPTLNIVLMSEHDSPRLRAQVHVSGTQVFICKEKFTEEFASFLATMKNAFQNASSK